MSDQSHADESHNAGPSPSASFSADGTPQWIGRYRILHEIGSGGMATVYAALQPQPRRTVALKVMKPDAAETHSTRRFRRESEILARLRHPSIAQVYDAGTYEHAGRTWPYFVMEYIAGAKTILEYVAQKQLNRRDRLKLFVSVCRAVEYGHQHRVLHRDLKPGNILIDQSGRLKIIDFGVASAPDLRVKDATMDTEDGRLVGTIQYMSPEQVASTPQDLDRRSDVYALGVLLYKLMTGAFPHDVEGRHVYEAVRIIREEEPVRPGKRNPELRGDLETIIMRAIAKSRSQRYRSAGELAADIVRFLNKQPIRARPARRLYRLRLYLQRHRAAVVTIAATMAVVLAAAGITAWALLQRNAAPSAAPSRVEPDPTPKPAARGAGGFGAGGPGTLLNEQFGHILSVTFTPDGRHMLSAAADGSVYLWSVPELDVRQELQAGADNGLFVRCSAAGNVFVTIGDDRTARVWNTDDRRIAHEFIAPGGVVHELAVNEDGSMLALAGSDLTARLVQLPTMQTTTLRSTTGALQSIAFNPEATLLVGGTDRGDVYLWNVSDGTRVARWNGFDHEVAGLTFDRSGSYIVAVDGSGAGAVWTVDAMTAGNDSAGQRFSACAGAVADVHVTAHRRWLAAASAQSVRLWDLNALADTGSIAQHGSTINTTQHVYSIAIDEQARWLAVGSQFGQMRVIELDSTP